MSITHWNCNSIKNKKTEFINFLNLKKPDLVSLNETKLGEHDIFNIKNYKTIRLDKNSRSGGVVILVVEGIKFDQTNIFDEFNLQIISVKIHVDSSTHFHFISWYLPPNDQLPNDKFFDTLNNLKSFILTGD